MSDKQWTLLLVSDDEPSLRQYRVSSTALRVGAAAGAALVLLLAAAVIYLLVEGSARLEAERLETENRELAGQLEEVQGRVGVLESRMASLAEKGERVRTMAGLEPIDSEVMEVGVGGPGSDTPEEHPLWSVDPDIGRTAFAVQYDLSALERRARLLSRSMGEAGDSLRAQRDLLRSTPSILPTAGLLSSRFSRARYHPIHHRPLPHEGIDISADRGTPILAAAEGKVTRARWVSGYGQMVEMDHGYGFVTRYGHASKLLVREGQEVERGDVIARVGETGIATSPHLHYEVRVGGRPVNPMNYVLNGSIP